MYVQFNPGKDIIFNCVVNMVNQSDTPLLSTNFQYKIDSFNRTLKVFKKQYIRHSKLNKVFWIQEIQFKLMYANSK